MNLNAEDIEERIIVIIEAPDFFLGRKVASTLGKCKWHDNSVECLLLDEEVSVRKVCVNLNNPNDHLYYLSEFSTPS